MAVHQKSSRRIHSRAYTHTRTHQQQHYLHAPLPTVTPTGPCVGNRLTASHPVPIAAVAKANPTAAHSLLRSKVQTPCPILIVPQTLARKRATRACVFEGVDGDNRRLAGATAKTL